MAYTIPTFNITCNISQPPIAGVAQIPIAPYRLTAVPCQLTYGRRVNVASTGGTGSPGVPLQVMNLLLAIGTDVRGPQDTVSFDMAEVPSGTGRWYQVIFVDDIGRGFSNEHRTAGIIALAGTWIAPYL